MSAANKTPKSPPAKRGTHCVQRLVRPCPVGTLVSYRSVDGTCRKVENYKHAWDENGTCANCGCSRKQAGYRGTSKPKPRQKPNGFFWRMMDQMAKCERPNDKLRRGAKD